MRASAVFITGGAWLGACAPPADAVPDGESPAGSTSEIVPYTPDWDGVVALAADHCAVCHVEGGAAASLPLPYAIQRDLSLGDGALVVPFDADASLLWAVLVGNGTGANAVMPLGTGPLDLRLIDPIRVWIEGGAEAPLLAIDGDGDGLTPEDGDCDDTDPAVGLAQTIWYEDADGDLFGATATGTTACEAPSGWVALPDDCDDTDPRFHPGATETCSDVDDFNCDGSVGAVDGDLDGFFACLECDDSDVAVNPDATERCNGVDDDCDGGIDLDAVDAGSWWPDVDGDGYGDLSAPAVVACAAPPDHISENTDCDDLDALVNPSAGVDPADGADNDCDGAIDEDAGATSFAVEVQPILDIWCVSCHGPPIPSDGMDLSGNAYGVLVGVSSGDVPAMARITPFATADSYLWHKVNNTHLGVGGSGSRMPKPPDPLLSAGELTAIEDWILTGAAP